MCAEKDRSESTREEDSCEEEQPHGNVPDHSSVALLLIDVINDLDFPEGKKLLTRALPMAKRLVSLEATC